MSDQDKNIHDARLVTLHQAVQPLHNLSSRVMNETPEAESKYQEYFD